MGFRCWAQEAEGIPWVQHQPRALVSMVGEVHLITATQFGQVVLVEVVDQEVINRVTAVAMKIGTGETNELTEAIQRVDLNEAPAEVAEGMTEMMMRATTTKTMIMMTAWKKRECRKNAAMLSENHLKWFRNDPNMFQYWSKNGPNG